MDMAFARFDRILARPLGVIPDFAVLVAGLSAKQSVSATARRQTTLDMGAGAFDARQGAMIALFAEGRKPKQSEGAGSFSPTAASALPLKPRE